MAKKAKTLETIDVLPVVEKPEIVTKDATNEIADINELGRKLTSSVESWKSYCASLTTSDACQGIEDDLLIEMDKNEAYIKGRTYTLPSEGAWADEKVTTRRCADAIVALLEKNEVPYNMTLGLYELSKFWRTCKAGESMPYGVFDSTLRALEQLKFKGYSEWKSILMVNNFFKPLHDDYARDITYSIYLAQVHNAVVDRMGEIENPAPAASDDATNA